MNNIILFDDEKWKSFLPLTYTRPICELRVGILTIKEKWEKVLEGSASYITQDYLSDKYPIRISNDNIIINSRWLPNQKIVSLVKNLEINDALLLEDVLIAARMDDKQFEKLIKNEDLDELKGIDLSKQKSEFIEVRKIYDLIEMNSQQIKSDFSVLTKNRRSEDIPNHCFAINKDDIFIEKGATVLASTFNAEKGPIYIDKNSKVMEGSNIRGPFALGESSQIKMGTRVYSGVSIGPYSKIGGEISSSIVLGYSNKGHDGYIGNSYLGEWCNLGAGTNCSNLKNNYTEVKIWDYFSESFEKTGLQFLGLIMGDHSKSGINSMFNTGTVVGVSSNVFGSGYPRTFIPSFSWGGAKGYVTYNHKKATEVAEIVNLRRGIKMTEHDRLILEHVFLSTSSLRNWEK